METKRPRTLSDLHLANERERERALLRHENETSPHLERIERERRKRLAGLAGRERERITWTSNKAAQRSARKGATTVETERTRLHRKVTRTVEAFAAVMNPHILPIRVITEESEAWRNRLNSVVIESPTGESFSLGQLVGDVVRDNAGRLEACRNRPEVGKVLSQALHGLGRYHMLRLTGADDLNTRWEAIWSQVKRSANQNG